MIDDRGTLVHVLSSARYEGVRVSAFLPGSIEIKTESASSFGLRNRSSRLDAPVDVPWDSTYKANVVASQDYTGCYLVLLFYDLGFIDGRVDNPALSFAFQKIGNLKAGIETKITAAFHYVDPLQKRVVYIPMFFSRGAEIRTEFADVLGQLFRRVEMLRHQKVIESYIQMNRHATLHAQSYLRFPPVFPTGVDPAELPIGLNVEFTVNADGTVEDIELSKVVRTEVLIGIQRAIGGWLFVPELRDGQPKVSRVSMQLAFESQAKKASASPAGQPSGN
jgi:hypothetical protein